MALSQIAQVIDLGIVSPVSRLDDLPTEGSDKFVLSDGIYRAIKTEADARTNAITAEADARTDAITAEANARTGAITAERTAREEGLATKVDKVEGSRLITTDEASKLNSIDGPFYAEVQPNFYKDNMILLSRVGRVVTATYYVDYEGSGVDGMPVTNGRATLYNSTTWQDFMYQRFAPIPNYQAEIVGAGVGLSNGSWAHITFAAEILIDVTGIVSFILRGFNSPYTSGTNDVSKLMRFGFSGSWIGREL